MKIPSRLKIRGKFIEIVWQHDLVEGEHLGKWDPQARTITIAANQKPHKTLEIALHEILHAISDIYDLKLTERQIEGVDSPLAKVVEVLFEENKEV